MEFPLIDPARAQQLDGEPAAPETEISSEFVRIDLKSVSITFDERAWIIELQELYN